MMGYSYNPDGMKVREGDDDGENVTLRQLLRAMCAMVGHGSTHERINDGPWVCQRCGGVNHRRMDEEMRWTRR